MTNTHTPAIGPGLGLNKLLAIAHAFLILSCVAAALVLAKVEDPRDASLTDLSLAVVLEAISWGAYPIIAFTYVLACKISRNSGTLLLLSVGAALVSEFPFDLAHSGQWVDMRQQSPLWALPLCWCIAKAWGVAGEASARNTVMLRIAAVVGALAWIIIFNVGLQFGLVYLGLVIVAFFLLFLWLWGKENTMMITAGLLGAGLMVTPAIGVIFMHYRAPLLEEKSPLPHPVWLVAYSAMLLVAALVGLML